MQPSVLCSHIRCTVLSSERIAPYFIASGESQSSLFRSPFHLFFFSFVFSPFKIVIKLERGTVCWDAIKGTVGRVGGYSGQMGR